MFKGAPRFHTWHVDTCKFLPVHARPVSDFAEQGRAVARPVVASPVEAGAMEAVALLALVEVRSREIHDVAFHAFL